jgi:hypothetical protein
MIYKSKLRSYGGKMARKQITTVRLERQAHRQARERLHLAYEYLIAGLNEAKQPVAQEKKPNSKSQEVKG